MYSLVKICHIMLSSQVKSPDSFLTIDSQYNKADLF